MGPVLLPRSSVQGISWPAILPPPASALLALQFQLEQSQWWSADNIFQQQLRQLDVLLKHAVATVHFYQESFKAVGYDPLRHGVSPDILRGLSLLKREHIQSAENNLVSQRIPQDHGQSLEHFTSGSMGKPIRTLGTEVTHFFWCAYTLRDHLWHKRDLTGRLAVIRASVPDQTVQGWGPATDAVYDTGLSSSLNIKADIDTQVRWLQQQDADYLLTYASNLRALAQACLDKNIHLPKLREVRSFGEMLAPDLRDLCREAWGVPLTDTYSSQEVGYIALQCPQHEHYHVQAESLLVEILNDAGMSCAPGEIGRVVVTTLHNFAMPLIRYETGDYAEVGEPCACGRGLPVLKRIMGRQRNLVTLPDGRKHWPSFPGSKWLAIAPVRQFQLIQRDLHSIEIRYVIDDALTQDQEQRLTVMLHTSLDYPFHINFVRMEHIERGANFKFEEFISELPS